MDIKTCLVLEEVEMNLYSHTRVAEIVELYHDLVELLMLLFISIIVQGITTVVIQVQNF